MMKLFYLCLIMLISSGINAQTRIITGVVKNTDGKPIPNASVFIANSKIGTLTNENGIFSFSVGASANKITISSIGSISQDISIKNTSAVVAILIAEDKDLQEVVVMGYQTVKRKEVTGSVATVGSTEISQKPIVSVTQLLQGKATGLQITGEGGRPGANAFIRVRGVTSFGGNEPLFILDGVQVSSIAYNLINPNDIEDITVLKDAAGASIYGSRGANGVLVITSKRGKGKAELKYSFTYGKSKALDLQNITLMNSQQKLQYEFEYGAINGYQNPNLAGLIATKVTAGSLPAGSTIFNVPADQRQSLWDELSAKGAGNWRNYYLHEATTKSHEISLSGGADKFHYFFSLNKSDNEGVTYGSYWNRIGGRLNVEYQALDWFKIGTNISVNTSNENIARELNNTQGAYTSLFTTNPYEPVRNANGSYNLTQSGYSPLEGTDFNPDVRNRITSFGSVFGEAKFFKYLTLRSVLGTNYNTLQRESYLKPGSNLAAILGYNSKTDGGNQDFNYVFTNTAAWRQTIAQNHSVNLLVGQEFNRNKFYSYSLTGRTFPSASFTTLDNSGTPTAATTSKSDFSLISYFASAGYDFKKKYFATGSIRRDGSSRFGADVRFANFWSAGVAWDIASEELIKNISIISALRFKASVGTTGNNNLGNYEALGVYSLANTYNNMPAASPLRLPNPKLTWETNKSYDIGVEFGVLDNRITGSFEYYQRKTSNLLYQINVSQTTGFSSYSGNIGNVENKGIELALTGNIIRSKDFNWSVSVNYSTVDNKITSLYKDDILNSDGISKRKIGQPINVFNLVRSAGVNATTGMQQWYKLDGTITSTYSGSDAIIQSKKSPIVKYFGSMSTHLNYKNLDLSAQFYYSGGNYIMNYMYQIGASNGANAKRVQFTDALNYWKKAGDITPFPSLTNASQNITYDSDKYLEKGDYITLRDVTIGYSIDEKLAHKVKMKGLRFYVQGTNLWLGTKFRGLPEVGQANLETTAFAPGQATLYAYPQLRAFTFGVDVKF